MPWLRAIYRRKSFYWRKATEGQEFIMAGGMEASCMYSYWSRMLRAPVSNYTQNVESGLELEQGSGILPPARVHHQLGTKCLVIWVYKGCFSFKPQQFPFLLFLLLFFICSRPIFHSFTTRFHSVTRVDVEPHGISPASASKCWIR